MMIVDSSLQARAFICTRKMYTKGLNTSRSCPRIFVPVLILTEKFISKPSKGLSRVMQTDQQPTVADRSTIKLYSHLRLAARHEGQFHLLERAYGDVSATSTPTTIDFSDIKYLYLPAVYCTHSAAEVQVFKTCIEASRCQKTYVSSGTRSYHAQHKACNSYSDALFDLASSTNGIMMLFCPQCIYILKSCHTGKISHVYCIQLALSIIEALLMIQSSPSDAVIISTMLWPYSSFTVDEVMSSDLSALIWYDYALTFNGEIQQMWKRKFSWISLLYYANRYSLLINAVIVMLMQFHWSGLTQTKYSVPLICVHFVTTEKVLNVIVGICVAVFNAVRVYALYGGHISLFITTLLLGVASPIISAYVWAITDPVLGIIVGIGFSCGVTTNSISEDMYLNFQRSLLLGSRISSLAADNVVLCLTLAEGYKTWRLCGGFGPYKTLRLMAEEGVLYYCVMVAINIVGIALHRIPRDFIVAPLWIGVLTSILISHFILDLRSSFHGSMSERSTATLTVPTVVFREQTSEGEVGGGVLSHGT
ncbi:hypothetical protein NM688_g5405 [Phlebia brevispora]|uniref:Uncharacterized protein n=1 Tax=Phlebia brevispora TaxID=194682 RepID=A0ACC1SVS4_9APHY|nr:hypothetical protein NM688_g5405 [Phlebia brevispora]